MSQQPSDYDFVSLDDFSLPPAKPDRARSLAVGALLVALLAALLGLGGLLVGGLLNPTPTPLAVDVVSLAEQIDEARATLTAFTTPDLGTLEARLSAQAAQIDEARATVIAVPDVKTLEARLSALEVTLQAMQIESREMAEGTTEIMAEKATEGATVSASGFSTITPNPAAVAQVSTETPTLTNSPTPTETPTLTNSPTPTETPTPTATLANITAQVFRDVTGNNGVWPRGCGLGSPIYDITVQVRDSGSTVDKPLNILILGQHSSQGVDCWLIGWNLEPDDTRVMTTRGREPAITGQGFVRKSFVRLIESSIPQNPAPNMTATFQRIASSVPVITLAPTSTSTRTPSPTPTPSPTTTPTMTPIPVVSQLAPSATP